MEFYGLARHRAGRTAILIEATTLGEALVAADGMCPNLQAIREGRVAPEYLISLGGTRFIADLNAPLATGSCVLVLGADTGG